MARPPKPTALKELNGSARHDPQRINQNEPKPARGIGPANSSLSEQQQAIWDEVVGISYAGVLGEADRIALEMMCRLIYEMRNDFEEMSAAKITQLSTLLGRFGMTPSDRSKIVIPKAPKRNSFASI